jgi:hypothetical protein
MKPTDFENYFDRWRDEVTDFTTDELKDELDHLGRKKTHSSALTVEELAKEDAIIAELNARNEDV